MAFFENLLDLFVDMSFYMVIGILFTGILHAFVKKEVILKHIGDDKASSVVKAAIFGVPLPLCSCGVVPTAIYLGKSGASKGAVISFLTSTPQTGIDSLIATYGLMGPFFAIYRAVAAFFSGIFSGLATEIVCKNEKISFNKETKTCSCSHESHQHSSCSCGCHSSSTHSSCSCSHHHEEHSGTSCSCGHDHEHHEALGFGGKIKSIFTYGFGEFLDEIAPNFVIGLIIAALISTLIPNDFLAIFKNPILSMLLMLIIGIPMYVCSTASIPIAVSLILKGISPGAAFVFLFAGPVTNIASLAILRKTLGGKVLGIYLGSVAFCSIAFGLLLDFILELTKTAEINQVISHVQNHQMPLYMYIVSAIFGILVVISLMKRFVEKN